MPPSRPRAPPAPSGILSPGILGAEFGDDADMEGTFMGGRGVLGEGATGAPGNDFDLSVGPRSIFGACVWGTGAFGACVTGASGVFDPNSDCFSSLTPAGIWPF
jgi:hypothetical protein